MRLIAPASPPDAMLAAKNFQNATFGSNLGIRRLMRSFMAKFTNCVGKYLPSEHAGLGVCVARHAGRRAGASVPQDVDLRVDNRIREKSALVHGEAVINECPRRRHVANVRTDGEIPVRLRHDIERRREHLDRRADDAAPSKVKDELCGRAVE